MFGKEAEDVREKIGSASGKQIDPIYVRASDIIINEIEDHKNLSLD